ncbi:hypothetical protein [uncultured Paraglaciecola sp.]|uniref:hypothetical protein n=1 Tax=uncultured Paraglaciecola sp. TaxID=1765024 RepID=UPI00339004F4
MSKLRNTFKFIPLVCFLAACNATQPPSYQADRDPEDRDTYVGAKGMAQYQKDQNYLVKKELSDKCSAAKVDLAVAKANEDKREIKRQTKLIDVNCIN